MKINYKKIILILIFILSVIFMFSILWIYAIANNHLYLNIFILTLFIFSIIYMKKCDKKTKHFIITLEILIVLLYLFTFIINVGLIYQHKKPLFYFYKMVYNDSTEYLCLYYAINEVGVKFPDNSIKNFYILYSYNDRTLGSYLFPQFITGKIPRSSIMEYLSENKK